MEDICGTDGTHMEAFAERLSAEADARALSPAAAGLDAVMADALSPAERSTATEPPA